MRNRKPRPPLNQLILSTLYHLTSVRRATKALRDLKREFVDWNEVRISHTVEVSSVISSAGWSQEAAERIVWMLREVYQLHNRMDLDHLGELTPTQARSCLTSLPMVSRRLADEVLLLSLMAPVLPGSEASIRMCHRLELLDNERITLKNQRALAKLFEEDYYPPLHFFFCDVAESICLAEEPACDRCPMSEHCPIP